MTNVRKRGTFRPQAAERSGRAAQNTALPPRCEHCRQPGIYRVTEPAVNGVTYFFCADHLGLGERNE